MATSSFLLTGYNVLANPSVGTNSTGGYENGGTMTVHSGTAVFQEDDIVEILVENVNANGEITGESRIVGMVVYDNSADYLNGTAKYNYTPMNPGQYANVQSDVSGLGDSYLRFNANVLTPEEPGAPTFNQLLVAPGTDLVNGVAQGSLTIDRITDTDYDNDGMIDAGTTEDGNAYFNAENNNLVVVCFARGTLIETGRGLRPVEHLEKGDPVRTLDRGLLPLRWIGSRTVPGYGRHAPVRIRAGALGNTRDLRVSQNHRMLITGPRAELLFAEPQVLVAAKHLVNDDSIRIEPCANVEYFHLMFDDHQIVFAESCPAESFFPGRQAQNAAERAARDELTELFQDLAALPFTGGLSRYELDAHEARAWQQRVPSPADRGGAPLTGSHLPRHRRHRAMS
ncbi:Hint domain-containing protein [Actibacterium sp. D379-3]